MALSVPLATAMLNPFHDLDKKPATFDPSWMLPDPDALPRHLKMPEDLRSTVDAAFEQAFTAALSTVMEDIRRKLHNLVHETIEQQVKQALLQYSDQVAGCEGAVIAARRTIHEESLGVNEKFLKIQSAVNENTRESTRLQNALAQAEKDTQKIQNQKRALEREKTQIRADAARLHAQEAKLNAEVAEVRDERKQILQWQQLLSQTEQELASREAHNQLYKGGAVAASRATIAARLGTPPAVESLDEAKRAVAKASPVVEKYEQDSRGRHGIRGSQAPMPLRMDRSFTSQRQRSGSPVPIEERSSWEGKF